MQSRTWLCPIQVHYWVRQPGKKSVAASVKSKSSMGQPRTENSRAVINFSPHCSHTTCNGVSWGNRQPPLALGQDDHGGGFEFSPSTYSHTLHTSIADTQTGGLRPQSERAWACLRKCERRRDSNTSHTNSLFGSIAYRITVTVSITATKCEMVVFLILVLGFQFAFGLKMSAPAVQSRSQSAHTQVTFYIAGKRWHLQV